MRNFQGTFETGKRSFITAFSICTTVPLRSRIFLDIFLQSPKLFFESLLAFLFENTNFYKYAVTFVNSHKIFKKTNERILRSDTGRKIDG